MIKRCILSLVILSIGLSTPLMYSSAENISIDIGVVTDGFWERYDDYWKLFREEILSLTQDEFDVRFPDSKKHRADWTAEGINNALDSLLKDPEVDIILALGLIASHEVAKRGDLPKPVIAPFILDAELTGIPYEEGRSGVKNFCYVNIPERTERELQAFQKVFRTTKLAYLINQRYLEAVPELRRRGPERLKDSGIEMQVIGVGEYVDAIFAEMKPETEAVILGPLTNLPPDEFRILVRELTRKRLPSFSGFEAADVESGILASVVSDMYPQIARRVALNIQRILLGEEPGSIPVNMAISEQLTINMDTARALDIYPDWEVTLEADLIHPERTDIERKLTLSSVAHEAIDRNVDLAAMVKLVEAGRQTIKQARSVLFPRVDVNGLAAMIDKDRAQASFGSQPERSMSGSISATQVIFSEPALAGLSIQKSLQKGREADYKTLWFDTVLSASTAYLNVLRAKTFERIQRENLKRIRANLETARVRESVGTAGPAEVFRWESEIATNRNTLVRTNAQRNLAEIEVNRILHRPLEEPFMTTETDLYDPVLVTSEDLLEYMKNPQTFRILRDFMVEEGLKASPEIVSIDAAIEAQARFLKSAANSLWMPTLALHGEVSSFLTKGGAGSTQASDLPPMFSFPAVDDTSWNVSLSLTFPLYKGGEKTAARVKADKELALLRLRREAISERMEQRIRSALHTAGSSYTSILQTRNAAEAADKTFSVVQEAYNQGAISIIRLIDAQNATFNAQQVAANAIYVFLLDLMEVERAIGRIEVFSNPEQRRIFLERAGRYIKSVIGSAGMDRDPTRHPLSRADFFHEKGDES